MAVQSLLYKYMNAVMLGLGLDLEVQGLDLDAYDIPV